MRVGVGIRWGVVAGGWLCSDISHPQLPCCNTSRLHCGFTDQKSYEAGAAEVLTKMAAANRVERHLMNMVKGVGVGGLDEGEVEE